MDAHALLSRRDVLQAGMGWGVALGTGGLWAAGGFPARSRAADGPPAADALARLPLITKAIPKSGEHLPVVGLGTDKFRNGERAAIRDEIAHLQQLGGTRGHTVIDTSADYGDSEALVGETLAALGVRDRMFVATKLTASGEGFFGDGVGGAASFQRSLQRLRTPRVDLLQVHNLDGVDTLMPLMQRWKQAGQIRYIGITTSEVGQHGELMGYMRRYAQELDFIQVDYSIANRDAARQVLPMAQQLRLGVLINVPFGYGSTLRDAASRRLPAWAAEIDVTSWAQFLLKYVASHEAVTCAIPGSTQTAHLLDNQGAARGRLPDAALRRKMEQYWDAV